MAIKSGRASDPLLGYQFELDLNGRVAGYFMEVSGIGSEHEVIEHKVVDARGRERVQMIPGRIRWERVVLKRGITDSMQMWDWRQDVVDGNLKAARQPVSIRMYDRNYELVAQWDLENAWPCKISGPALRADSSDVAVEELTLAHEGLTRRKV